jgi:hypothetical protein
MTPTPLAPEQSDPNPLALPVGRMMGAGMEVIRGAG